MFRKLLVLTSIALVAFLMLSFCVGTLNAQTIVKANNTTSLATGTSWVGGVVPGSANVAQWNSTVTSSNTVTLGSPLYFGEISIQNPGGPVTINNDANTLGLAGIGGTGIDMSNATQNLTLNCPVLLGSTQTWNVASARTLSVGGVISGASGVGVTIAGGGTTLFSGSNTYNGGTIIAGGTLKAGTYNAFGPNGSSVTAQSGATLDLNGLDQSEQSTPSCYYTISVSGSGVNGNGAIQNNSGTAGYVTAVTLSGDTAFGGSHNWTMVVAYPGAPLFSGNGFNLTKVGNNEVDFGGSLNTNWTVAGVKNLYVNSGTLGVISNYFTTGIDNSQPGSIFVNSGGVFCVGSTLPNYGGVSIVKPIVMSGGTLQTIFTDIGRPAAGSAAIAAAISLNTTGTLALQASSSLTLNGVISDGSSANGILLTMTGTGSPAALVLTASNTYSGDTTINQGTLQFGNGGAIPSGSGKGNVHLASGTMLDLNGQNATVNGLFGTGTINNTSATGATLNFGNNNVTSTFSGIIENTSGLLSIVKSGAGTTTLSGFGLYSGATTINQGKLDVDGSLTNSAVTVNSGGILSGTGSLASVTVNSGGTLAPGDPQGVMHLNGSLSLAAGAKLDYDLDGNPADNEVSMPSAVLALDDQQFSDFNFMFLAGFGRGVYTLIDASSVSGSLGLNTSGMIDGYPATLAVQGNNLVLNVVPEPSTLVLLAAGAIGLIGYGWRRRRAARRTAKPAAFEQQDDPSILAFPSRSSVANAARKAA